VIPTEDSAAPLDGILELLRQFRTGAMETSDLLRSSRLVVESNTKQLENPKAVLEYIDFFLDLIGRTLADLDRLGAELPDRVDRAHVELLRQLANNAAAEQRRCLIFRDKWINKPLPYEQMRSILNQISTDSRDQLTEYRNLLGAADRLEALAAAPQKPADDEGRLGRRELFTKWFGR
jgi:hypothetical protein